MPIDIADYILPVLDKLGALSNGGKLVKRLYLRGALATPYFFA